MSSGNSLAATSLERSAVFSSAAGDSQARSRRIAYV